MSRRNTRARKRCARHQTFVETVAQLRDDIAAFVAFLGRLAASDDAVVWAIARDAARLKPFDDAELAMIAQIVAPGLAGMTPGSVYRRHKQAERLP